MKTIDEVFVKCKTSDSILGFEVDALLTFIPFEQVKPFLRDDATEEEWNKAYKPLTVKNVLAEMEEYMEFAWGKVEDHRGISASRSVEKMQAWLWVLDDTKTLQFAEDDSNYENYGAPILMKICEIYGFTIPDDEGIHNMAQGKPYHDGCEEGCGRI